MGIRKARSSYEEEEEPRAIDGEVQSMRSRELENAVGKEEKARVPPPLSQSKQIWKFLTRLARKGKNKPLNTFREDTYYPQSRLNFPKTPGNPASTLHANAVLTHSGRGGMGFFGGWVGEWERGGKVKNRLEGVRSRGYIEEPDEGGKKRGGWSSKEACG